MNLYHIRYFVTLAHVKHYTNAAKMLCITQPSLSHAIAQLEEELGVQLFEKNGRNTTLTKVGEEFLIYAKRALETLDSGVELAKSVARGEGIIRLGLVRPLGVEWLPDMVAQFMKDNPDKNIRFTFNTDVTANLLQGINEQNYDIVFCSKPHNKNLSTVPIKRQELVLIVPESHMLAYAGEISLKDTKDYPYIFFNKNSGIRPIIDDMFERENIIPKIVYENEEDEVVAGLVAAGFGIAVVPYMDILERMKVKVLKITSPEYERNFYMVTNPDIYMQPATKLFCEYIKNNTNIQKYSI